MKRGFEFQIGQQEIDGVKPIDAIRIEVDAGLAAQILPDDDAMAVAWVRRSVLWLLFAKQRGLVVLHERTFPIPDPEAA